MHIGAKKVATAGLMAALSVVLLCLASVIETSSLFFIAAASFCVGIAIREWGLRYGFAFFMATMIIGVLVAPNKLYCVTFAAMSIYLLGSELIWRIVAGRKILRNRKLWCWFGKYMLFNVMYIPILLFFPRVLVTGKMNGIIFVVLVFVGQVGLFLYDMAHHYVQSVIWGKFQQIKKQ